MNVPSELRKNADLWASIATRRRKAVRTSQCLQTSKSNRKKQLFLVRIINLGENLDMGKIFTSVFMVSILFLAGCQAKHNTSALQSRPTETSTESSTTSTQAKTEGQIDNIPHYLECKWDNDIRVIERLNTENDGCEVQYTKNYEKTTIATAEHDLDHCLRVIQRIKTNLEKAGFSCDD